MNEEAKRILTDDPKFKNINAKKDDTEKKKTGGKKKI
jgi:hypothetical protein